MRRSLALALAAGLIALTSTGDAFAQQRRDRSADKAAEDAARQKRIDEEMALDNLPLPDVANAGPCPFVKILYDAARYVEFKDNRQASAAVVFSGELEGVSAYCAYKAGEPITVTLMPTFSFGRGPQATTPTRQFQYWVAVTNRDEAVLNKQWMSVAPVFPAGKDRVVTTGETTQITIPRKDDTVSGANFEILVGFEVTPQMAEFNRQGSRFTVTSAGTAAAGTPAAQ
jgi:hypothetical protein